jgi:hypothetical protein
METVKEERRQKKVEEAKNKFVGINFRKIRQDNPKMKDIISLING